MSKGAPQIKICGMTSLADIHLMNRVRPDYVGFVFAQGSRRQVTKEQAKTLRQGLAKGILPVGVFRDEDPERIVHLCREGIIDGIQLHGGEDETYLEELQRYLGSQSAGRSKVKDRPLLIKAFHISEPGEVMAALDFPTDMVMLDSGGGTGRTLPWEELAEGVAKGSRPWFLAGGLTPENVAEAIRMLHPDVVDVSSGVEREDGRGKDPEKVQAFCEAVRNAMGNI